MEQVKFAILGCGNIGSRHMAKLQGVVGATLVGVCDMIPERARALGEQYHCPHFLSLDELVKNTDADYVNICTPSGLHAEHSVTALEAGFNVLCEKPMALSVVDARRMVDIAHRMDKSLFVVKQNRYNPPVRYVASLIAQGKLGRPLMSTINMYWNRTDAYYASEAWRGTQKFERSTLFSQVSHFADLMIYFMGKPEKVAAFMSKQNHDAIEIDDTGVVSIQFQNGAIGSLNYTTCATEKNFEGSITLIYSKGTVRIGGAYLNEIEYFQVDGIEKAEYQSAPLEVNDYGAFKGSASNHENVFRAIVAKELNNEDEVDLVRILATGESGVEGVQFMEKAVEAAEQGVVLTL